MQEQAIIDGNKLIAEFLKYPEGFPHKIDEYGYEQTVEGFKIEDNDVALEDLRFHKSWDWLMPVVEKIEEYNNHVSIMNKSCCIFPKGKNISHSYTNGYINKNSKIEATWFAIVEFIKWYNKCQK